MSEFIVEYRYFVGSSRGGGFMRVTACCQPAALREFRKAHPHGTFIDIKEPHACVSEDT